MMQLEGKLSAVEACRTAEVSRAGFYRFLREDSPREAETELRDQIQQVALVHRSYGYRRVAATLRAQGIVVNHKCVLRIMREDNLLCIRKKRFVLTTQSRHGMVKYPNLAPQVDLTAVNQLWVADLTYIRLREEFVYLAVVLDAFSRRVVGWEVGPSLQTSLALKALQRALEDRAIAPGIMHHSDQGVQYCCTEYVDTLLEHGFAISMSRKGNPYDNAKAESFMKTLKAEEVDLRTYQNLAEARDSVQRFVEEVYNSTRLHSALGYLSPDVFEQQQRSKAAYRAEAGQ